MKNINLAYVNLAFVVVGVIVIAYTFSVTFLSSTEMDQLLDIETLSYPQEGSLEVPAAIPPGSAARRNSGTQSGPSRAPDQVRNTVGRSSSSPSPTVRTPSSVRRPQGTSSPPSVSAGRPSAGSPASRGFSSQPSSLGTRPSAQTNPGFVVTPSQGIDREKRSAPQTSSPNRPPVRGSMDR